LEARAVKTPLTIPLIEIWTLLKIVEGIPWYFNSFRRLFVQFLILFIIIKAIYCLNFIILIFFFIIQFGLFLVVFVIILIIVFFCFFVFLASLISFEDLIVNLAK